MQFWNPINACKADTESYWLFPPVPNIGCVKDISLSQLFTIFSCCLWWWCCGKQANKRGGRQGHSLLVLQWLCIDGGFIQTCIMCWRPFKQLGCLSISYRGGHHAFGRQKPSCLWQVKGMQHTSQVLPWIHRQMFTEQPQCALQLGEGGA